MSIQTDDVNTDPLDPWDVAIVGAGPIGLLLAGELAERALRVVVLERTDSPSTVPKANGIVGHAAVELATRGVFRGTRLRVVSPPRFFFGPLELKLGFGPRNPLHLVAVPQRRLEELLERRAAARGALVCRGQEVTGFAQDAAGVTVEVRGGKTALQLRASHGDESARQLRASHGDETARQLQASHGDETTRQLRASYLVGCDGAHSLVRKAADIGFPGFTSDQLSRIARVTIPADRLTRTGRTFEIAGVGTVTAMRPNLLPGGAFSIAPMAVLDRSAPNDLYLISTHESRGDGEPSDSVSVEELRTSLHRVLGAELPFTEATAIRSVVGNSRQANAYRLGRVFLAGDAAHVFNAGGSSLNIGLHDALELARRLGTVLRGEAGVDELDGYEATRRPAGERALRQTRAQAALGRNDDDARALRETFGDVLTTRSSRRLARLIEDG